MSRRQHRRGWHGAARRGAGAAAIEFCLCLITVFTLLPLLMLFGQVFLYYHVLLNASRDAAHYMAVAPQGELLNLASRTAVRDNARRIVLDAVRDLAIAPDLAASNIAVNCDASACDQFITRPAAIRVFWSVEVPKGMLGGFLDNFNGGEKFTLQFDVTVAYVN